MYVWKGDSVGPGRGDGWEGGVVGWREGKVKRRGRSVFVQNPCMAQVID